MNHTILTNKFRKHQQTIQWCLLCTLLWGMVTHGYSFFSGALTHDSMNEFNALVYGNDIRIAYGRIFVPLYRKVIRGSMALPWLIGALSMLYLSVSLFFISRLFRLNSKPKIFLTAGILVANLSLSATAATYIHDLDCNTFSLMFAVLAAYLWRAHPKGFLPGIVAACISLGMYQSYISVTITLVVMVCILELLEGRDHKAVFFDGLKAIVMLLGSAVLYLGSMKLTCAITGIELVADRYNSITIVFDLTPAKFLLNCIEGYKDTIKCFLTTPALASPKLILLEHVLMVLGAGVVVLLRLCSKELHPLGKGLVVLLAALIPIAINTSHILIGGFSHDLMHYAFWFMYLFVLLLAWEQVDRLQFLPKVLLLLGKTALVALVALLLLQNVRTANGLYLKKDLESRATEARFSQILLEMERTEDYIPGETPVVFIGHASEQFEKIPGFRELYRVIGQDYTSALGASASDFFQHYFDYILLADVRIPELEEWDKMQFAAPVEDMPVYPAEGSILLFEDTLIVKLGPSLGEQGLTWGYDKYWSAAK